MPQDEVEVQRDHTTAEVVIQYLDHFGKVVLQVPSSQVSASPRIEQDLEQATKSRANPVAEQEAGEGGSFMGISLNPSTLLSGQGIDVSSLVQEVLVKTAVS